jgi:hypothetical protein
LISGNQAFLAFNTSTVFSPTDTSVLTRWAKLTAMLQSLIFAHNCCLACCPRREHSLKVLASS